jgi:hypothetical protein
VWDDPAGGVPVEMISRSSSVLVFPGFFLRTILQGRVAKENLAMRRLTAWSMAHPLGGPFEPKR